MSKIKIVKDNVLLSIEEEELAQYEARGYSKLGATKKVASAARGTGAVARKATQKTAAAISPVHWAGDQQDRRGFTGHPKCDQPPLAGYPAAALPGHGAGV